MSGRLIETTVWVSLLRSRTPRPLRERLADLATADDAVLCEPVLFGLEACQTDQDWPGAWRILEITPMVATPARLWKDAAHLGRELQRQGVLSPALDLLIAQVALHHGATVVRWTATSWRCRQPRRSRWSSSTQPSARRNVPPAEARHKLFASSPCGDGPLSTAPSVRKREPWQGQSQLFASSFQRTTPPRCGHTADKQVSAPAGSR